MYNRSSIRVAVISLATSVVSSNFVFLLYPGMSVGFVEMVFRTGLSSILYPYALIPIVPIIALWLLNYDEVIAVWAEGLVQLRTSVFRSKKYPALEPR